MAAACATIGLFVALFPDLWMGLFSDDQEIVRLGTWYLRIVGPVYGLYGLGMALYFATQGFGSVIWTMTAKAVRLLASGRVALITVYGVELGAIGFFITIAGGFCAYAALTAAVDVQGQRSNSGAKHVTVTEQLRRRTNMFRSCIFGLLVGSVALTSVTQAGEVTCKPALTFEEVRFSPMQPPTMERKWTAVLSVDASRCATTSGRFGIVFSRQKENGLEMDFQEQFTWKPALLEVSINFSADEAVERYWLYNVAPCPCRD